MMAMDSTSESVVKTSNEPEKYSLNKALVPNALLAVLLERTGGTIYTFLTEAGISLINRTDDILQGLSRFLTPIPCSKYERYHFEGAKSAAAYFTDNEELMAELESSFLAIGKPRTPNELYKQAKLGNIKISAAVNEIRVQTFRMKLEDFAELAGIHPEAYKRLEKENIRAARNKDNSLQIATLVTDQIYKRFPQDKSQPSFTALLSGEILPQTITKEEFLDKIDLACGVKKPDAESGITQIPTAADVLNALYDLSCAPSIPVLCMRINDIIPNNPDYTAIGESACGSWLRGDTFPIETNINSLFHYAKGHEVPESYRERFTHLVSGSLRSYDDDIVERVRSARTVDERRDLFRKMKEDCNIANHKLESASGISLSSVIRYIDEGAYIPPHCSNRGIAAAKIAEVMAPNYLKNHAELRSALTNMLLSEPQKALQP
jgi:hypothetical protein